MHAFPILLGLVLAGVFGFVLWVFGSTFVARRAVERVGRVKKTLFAGEHQLVEATPADFGHLDVAYYDRIGQQLEESKFRFLADIEDLTASRAFPLSRTFIRYYVSDDGATTATVFNIRPLGWLRLQAKLDLLPSDMKVIDLETEFADGTFLATSNTQGFELAGPWPGIHTQSFESSVKLGTMLQRHKRQLRELSEDNPPKTVSSLAEGLEAQDRMQRLKNDSQARS